MAKQMVRILIGIVLFLCIATGAQAAPAEDSRIEGALFERLSVGEINEFIARTNAEMQTDIAPLTYEAVKEIAAKGAGGDWNAMLKKAAGQLFRELKANIHLMGKLLTLGVLCALLHHMQTSFEQSSVALLAYALCFAFLSVIVVHAAYNCIELARSTVDNMVGFLEALLPLLISLLAGVGAVTSAAMFTPLMLFAVSSISIVVKDVVLPFFFLATALECVHYLSDHYRLNNLLGLMKQAGMVVLGILLVLFVGVITIQGAAGSVADGLTLRTAKFAAATFIPVVGKVFSDAVDMVMGASLLLKNAVGIFGVITVAAICIVPLIKMFVLIAVIKITGAVIQPMGDEKMAACLDAVGNNLLLVFAAVLTVAVMFFLAIVMIVATGGAAAMLR